MKKYIVFFLLLLIALRLHGQENDSQSLFSNNYHIKSQEKGNLYLSIDNLSFLRNNEYDGDFLNGYTIPGFQLRPRAILFPTSAVKLEAGISLLKFWGADKYPCYSYQGISEWVADDYQYGFHIQPFFRAQLRLSDQIDILLGMLYGGSNHQIPEQLYNPELNLSADPETGVQFLYNSRIACLDMWVDWQSFTFKNDTHNESMSLGLSSTLNLNDPSSLFSMQIPLQALGIHRGGEIDTTENNTYTILNASTGLNFNLNLRNSLIKKISLDLRGAIYREIGSEEMIFSDGWALFSNLSVDIWRLRYKMGWWKSSDFINLFGNPFYGNISTTIDGRIFLKPDIFTFGLSYEQGFGNGIFFGADVNMIYIPDLVSRHKDDNILNKSSSFNHSVGVYLRINPSILLKKNIF